MTPSSNSSVATFTASERMYIRRELDQFFSTLPTVAEGFQLKSWRTGAKQGQPKLSPAAESLVERGLMRLDAALRPPRIFFTEAGLAALRAMMADRRLANPADFAHVRQELGIDPPRQDETAAG
jgi:2-hydroxychromene-2-carboxylate isomerase